MPPAEPVPAWPSPQVGWGELPKLDFDSATHVAMAGDVVYFGSAVDNGVHALDAQTGRRRWTFFTEGPVRLAPTVAGGRVYAGSDDGLVYCLQAADGRRRGACGRSRAHDRILGAGRLMSLWPVRTGVVVDGGVAYCGAGLFPARQTALLALDAQDGTTLWQTSEAPRGSYMPLAPQGYLLASPTQLYVPCGRAAPLAYVRADGAVRAAMDKSYAIVGAKGVVSGGLWGADRRRVLRRIAERAARVHARRPARRDAERDAAAGGHRRPLLILRPGSAAAGTAPDSRPVRTRSPRSTGAALDASPHAREPSARTRCCGPTRDRACRS